MGTKRITKSLLALLLIGGLLTGCGEVVVFGHTVREGRHSSSAEAEPVAPPPSSVEKSAAPDTPAKPVTVTQAQKVKAVSVTLSANADAEAKQDSKFKFDALFAAIKGELLSRKLLDESDQAIGIAEIVIDEYALHRTTNAVVFGKIYSNGVLNGAIRLRDAHGDELSNRRVEAKVRLSLPDEGEIGDALEPLYHEFAFQTGNVLTR